MNELDRRVVVREETAKHNRAASREPEDLLSSRVDPQIEASQPPNYEEYGRFGAAITAQDYPETTQEPTAHQNRNPESNGEYARASISLHNWAFRLGTGTKRVL